MSEIPSTPLLTRLLSAPLRWLGPLLSLFPHLIIIPFLTGPVMVLLCLTCFHISTKFFMHSLLITLMMEAVYTSESFVTWETTQYHIPEGCRLHTTVRTWNLTKR
jgi:hypothetical protein